MPSPRTHRLPRIALAAAAGLFVVGFFAAPLWRAAGWWGPDVCFGGLCHQMPERSLGWPLGIWAVCARCAGLYLGGFAALLAAVPFGPRGTRGWGPRLFLFAVAPTAIDALLGIAGLPQLGSVGRFVLALPAGFVCGGFLSIGFEDLLTGGRVWPRWGDVRGGVE